MVRSILHVVVNFLLRVFCRLEVQGRENIPELGPAILASNHLHLLDAPLVFGSVHRKDLVPIVADTHRKTWWLRILVDAVHGIWINRGGADKHALRASLEHLKHGGMIGIAPEGTRSRTGALITAKTGVAFMAQKAGVPILPVGIWGTETALRQIGRFRRPGIHIRFGEPFRLPPLGHADHSEALQENTDEIMRQIAILLPERYRGVYQDGEKLEKV